MKPVGLSLALRSAIAPGSDIAGRRRSISITDTTPPSTAPIDLLVDYYIANWTGYEYWPIGKLDPQPDILGAKAQPMPAPGRLQSDPVGTTSRRDRVA